MFIIAAAGTVKALMAVTISLHPGTHHVPASYTVQQGDSLSAIAAHTYGNLTALVDPRFSGQPTPPKTLGAYDIIGRKTLETNPVGSPQSCQPGGSSMTAPPYHVRD